MLGAGSSIRRPRDGTRPSIVLSEKCVSAIETFGVALPGIIVEAVADPDHPDHLRLHTWNGRGVTTTRNLEYKGVAYIPKRVVGGLVQSVRFAPPSLSFGSTEKLVVSLRDFLSGYAGVQPEVADLLVAFALATWFCDCMPVAPFLYLFGPDDAVSIALRLLGCICRRPVLLGDVDCGGLATLPSQLGATLLINQRALGRRVRRILLASNRRHFCTIRGSSRLDLYGAKAFTCEGSQVDEHGLKVSLSSHQDPLPFLADSEEEVIAQRFQARLLRYRMVHYERVRDSSVDCSAFVTEMREEARAWLAPIYDCRELSKSVFKEMLRQSREASEARFFDPKCLVAEAALYFCHKQDVKHLFIGDLAEKVNVLLQGRHEDSNLSAKRVGLVLRELGVHGERVAEGYRVDLTDDVRESIHRLALDYRVLSVDDGVRRCRFCPTGRATSKQIQ
jgi:hypothetical protein